MSANEGRKHPGHNTHNTHNYKNFNTQDNMENKCDAITARGTRCTRNWSAQTVMANGGHHHWCGQHCDMYTRDRDFRVDQRRRREAAAAPANHVPAFAPHRAVARRDRIADVRRAIEFEMQAAPNLAEAQRRFETAMAIFDGQGVGAAEALRVVEDAMRAIRGEVVPVVAQAPVEARRARRRAAPEVLAARHQVRPAAVGAAAHLPVVNNIGALARDNQNIHTAVVADQTNAGMEKLLSQHVPADQHTMMEIWNMWTSSSKAGHNPRGALQLFGDMLKWYETPDCKAEGDFLYKRMIDGLWALVQRTPDAELRNELRWRVAQEVMESNGMCCEGHISRLVNVMVGFDDAFKPPVSTGEMLQQKMAAIAAKELETELKQAEARDVFAELGIPVAEQAAWLEAF